MNRQQWMCKWLNGLMLMDRWTDISLDMSMYSVYTDSD